MSQTDVKKTDSIRKKWSKKDKIDALLLLERYDFNLSKTARELNITKQTLSYWKSVFGDSVWGSKKEQAAKAERKAVVALRDKIEEEKDDLAILKAARRLQLNEGDLINSVYVAKFTLMDKIVELTKQSTNIKDVAYALDIIQKAEQTFLDKDMQNEFTKRKNSFMQMVMEQYPGVDIQAESVEYEVINND